MADERDESDVNAPATDGDEGSDRGVTVPQGEDRGVTIPQGEDRGIAVPQADDEDGAGGS